MDRRRREALRLVDSCAAEIDNPPCPPLFWFWIDAFGNDWNSSSDSDGSKRPTPSPVDAASLRAMWVVADANGRRTKPEDGRGPALRWALATHDRILIDDRRSPTASAIESVATTLILPVARKMKGLVDDSTRRGGGATRPALVRTIPRTTIPSQLPLPDVDCWTHLPSPEGDADRLRRRGCLYCWSNHSAEDCEVAPHREGDCEVAPHPEGDCDVDPGEEEDCEADPEGNYWGCGATVLGNCSTSNPMAARSAEEEARNETKKT